MTKVIAFFGEKQAGKSTGAIKVNNIISSFKINDGNYCVKDYFIDEDGLPGIKDINIPIYTRNVKDLYLLEKAVKKCKIYNFADPMKSLVHELFGVPYNLLYGTDEDKNTLTDVTWGDIVSATSDVNLKISVKKQNSYDEKLTIRELMKRLFDILRKVDQELFTKATTRKIKEENPEFAIIGDGRFPHEYELLSREFEDCKFIRLVKQNDDDHNSEKDIQTIPKEAFSLTIETANLDINLKNQLIEKFIHDNYIY